MDGLFYQVRQALAAVGKGLKIRFSEFSLGLSYFCSSTYQLGHFEMTYTEYPLSFGNVDQVARDNLIVHSCRILR
jgi:hypothetical protein